MPTTNIKHSGSHYERAASWLRPTTGLIVALYLVMLPLQWGIIMKVWGGIGLTIALNGSETQFLKILEFSYWGCAVLLSAIVPIVHLSRILNPERAQLAHYDRALSCLLIVASFLLLTRYSIFGSSAHNGLEGLSIQSGSAFCVISIFVAYRVLRAKIERSSAEDGFYRTCLYILSIAPWLFQVAHGFWFGVLEQSGQGSYAQQMLLSFGFFLLPLGGVFLSGKLGLEICEHLASSPLAWLSSAGLIAITSIGSVVYWQAGLSIALI